jgi:large subunit ribosomal protein L30
MTRIEIRQQRSAIGEKKGAKQNLAALGLGRTGQVVSHEDSATVRGMLRKVAHLVVISEDKDGKR